MKKYKFLFAISVIAIGLMTVLLASINEKKEEKESLLSVPKIEKWKQKMKSLENSIQENLIHGNKQKTQIK
ncbi:hypothetical protein [Aliarcobacter butzleri]|uniref:hypothetical protein n=1 Tax=Aliarcobacter butzleri TaxID=28197 RepID=UPI001E405018|nr:hypothetical protein [Aliarcobacter butzleri]